MLITNHTVLECHVDHITRDVAANRKIPVEDGHPFKEVILRRDFLLRLPVQPGLDRDGVVADVDDGVCDVDVLAAGRVAAVGVPVVARREDGEVCHPHVDAEGWVERPER